MTRVALTKAEREERDRLINKRYWDNPTVNLRDVAKEFDMTRQRIHQIITKDSPFAPAKPNARELALADRFHQLDILSASLPPHQRNQVGMLVNRSGICTEVVRKWLDSKSKNDEQASIGVLATKTTRTSSSQNRVRT